MATKGQVSASTGVDYDSPKTRFKINASTCGICFVPIEVQVTPGKPVSLRRENLTLARINFALTASESGLKEKTLALNAGGASIVFAKSGKESITVSQNERKCKSTLEI
eukprot:TRINITY_DN2241_c0_g3_i4.p2 TRINITY_DN2241_c0_g3~~TRINITY_DN2241_c0_g3_i4.p2  ORF type:complete len:109 (-),score=18.71 TRINITY_DN2241_c0_g3_i4:587-913(-)